MHATFWCVLSMRSCFHVLAVFQACSLKNPSILLIVQTTSLPRTLKTQGIVVKREEGEEVLNHHDEAPVPCSPSPAPQHPSAEPIAIPNSPRALMQAAAAPITPVQPSQQFNAHAAPHSAPSSHMPHHTQPQPAAAGPSQPAPDHGAVRGNPSNFLVSFDGMRLIFA